MHPKAEAFSAGLNGELVAKVPRSAKVLCQIGPGLRNQNCWHCNSDLIWGGYRDIEEEEGGDFFMVTNLSCPKCDAHVEVYAAKKD